MSGSVMPGASSLDFALVYSDSNINGLRIGMDFGNPSISTLEAGEAARMLPLHLSNWIQPERA